MSRGREGESKEKYIVMFVRGGGTAGKETVDAENVKEFVREIEKDGGRITGAIRV